MTLLHNSIVYYKTIQHLTYLCYIFPLNPNQPIITIVHIQCKAYLNLRIYQMISLRCSLIPLFLGFLKRHLEFFVHIEGIYYHFI